MKKISKSKAIFSILAVIIFLTGFSMETIAQKRKTPVRKAPAKKTTPVKAADPVVVNNANIRDGAQKVSIQIKNVSKFVYLLGGIARTIENLDAEAKTRRVAQSSIDANNKNKQSVIQGIRNLRAGIAALEIDFRTTPGLQNYLFQIDGVSNLVGSAENQAVNGQFTESGKTLLLVIEKLSDTLVALP